MIWSFKGWLHFIQELCYRNKNRIPPWNNRASCGSTRRDISDNSLANTNTDSSSNFFTTRPERCPTSDADQISIQQRRDERSGQTSQHTRQSWSNTGDLVHNISRQILSSDEVGIFNRGLSFCPKSYLDPFQLDQDLYWLFRSIRWKVHFFHRPFTHGEPVGDTLDCKSFGLLTKSKSVPPTSYAPVETFV